MYLLLIFGVSCTDAMSVLNAAFASAGFVFNLAGTINQSNTAWTTHTSGSGTELQMKTATRQGDKSTLNIWSCVAPRSSRGSTLLGYATFPINVESNLARDGVVIGTQTNPGGSQSPYNLGDTLVHEVGHW